MAENFEKLRKKSRGNFLLFVNMEAFLFVIVLIICMLYTHSLKIKSIRCSVSMRMEPPRPSSLEPRPSSLEPISDRSSLLSAGKKITTLATRLATFSLLLTSPNLARAEDDKGSIAFYWEKWSFASHRIEL